MLPGETETIFSVVFDGELTNNDGKFGSFQGAGSCVSHKRCFFHLQPPILA